MYTDEDDAANSLNERTLRSRAAELARMAATANRMSTDEGLHVGCARVREQALG